MYMPKLHNGWDSRRVEAKFRHLPNDHGAAATVTDKYFNRGTAIMQNRDLNPWVAYQLFVRRTNKDRSNIFVGSNWVIAALAKFTKFFQNGGRVYSVPEGSTYESCETLMVLEGRALDFFWLETLYLSQISGDITAYNDNITEPNFNLWEQRCREVVQAARVPMIYMGTRHYYWWLEKRLSQIARDAGFTGASTDVGSTEAHGSGMGTIPHALECIFALEYGYEKAVVETTVAFNEVYGPQGVPTIALIDFRNRELEDTQACLDRLGQSLWGIRLDTHGGVTCQGAVPAGAKDSQEAKKSWIDQGLYLPKEEEPIHKYWCGNGTSITGAYRLREVFDRANSETKLLPTSGFGDPRKIWAWREAEDLLGKRLFDASGCGELSDKYRGGRFATSDIFAGGSGPDQLVAVHKVGRPPVPNPKLKLIAGDGDPSTPYDRIKDSIVPEN